MKKACSDVSLQVAVDGEQAIGYLSGSGPFADRQAHPLPALILLDLRMPIIPGLDVLKWIRKQSAFQTLPVLILSSSESDSDIETAYRLGANSYFVKPLNPGGILALATHIRDHWLEPNPQNPLSGEANYFIKYPPRPTHG